MGGRPVKQVSFDVFSATQCLQIPSGIRVALDPRVKSRWLDRMDELKPDIIHAHDVIVASFLLDTEYAAIYDDHEYWSKNLEIFSSRGLIEAIANKPISARIPNWERQLLERFPVITVSEAIAEEHRQFSSWVGVVHNYPYLSEVAHLKNQNHREGIVYVGWDFNQPRFKPYRDLTGLPDLLDFDVLTGLPHDELFHRLTHYRIGLLAFKEHPWHLYSDANKMYNYLHAGLQVITNKLIAQSTPDNPHVFTVDSHANIRNVIDSIPEVDNEEIMSLARERYVWDLQESTITKAYDMALG
ncbi:MAG: hypothetical protein ACFFEE_06955 [Candidatus Thorarchaeota archaeon]